MFGAAATSPTIQPLFPAAPAWTCSNLFGCHCFAFAMTGVIGGDASFLAFLFVLLFYGEIDCYPVQECL